MSVRALFALSFVLCACATGPRIGTPIVPDERVEAEIAAILEQNGVTTAAVGVLQAGELVWSGAWGEEAPGVPATPETAFDVASITKTVVAETALRLAAQGKIDLDEPMARYWTDPDIADDPRRELLTPRLVLTHSTGFPNWRFFRRDGKLTFEKEPGTAHTYSGEGFEYLARFIEAKLGRPFPEIARETVLGPLGMERTAIAVSRGDVTGIARPQDADGSFYGFFCRPPRQGGACAKEGSYSAAGGMLTSLPDYARFLGAVLGHEGYSSALAEERDTVLVPKTSDDRIVFCTPEETAPCPEAQGYGLGFEVVAYPAETVIGHGGWDWLQLTLAYAYKGTGNGVLIFLNTRPETGLAAMNAILERLDPSSPYLAQYRRWEAREAAKAED